ncbi:MAG TPA: SusD/RagB family nutrient-binding outer membrane lipoprotein, partial [Chitinophagaceae bacterium]|nr:SusD/RagB family nutrient-binding outer membrane lipoprotein [Chitinophagaceae bacterium]
MKLNKIIYVVLLAALIGSAGTGCRKGQFNINKNINNPTDSTITYFVVLPAALNHTSRNVNNRWGVIQNWMSYWARSGTYAPAVTEETYQITTNFGTGIWDNVYDNNYDYAIIQTKAAVAGASFYEGIARIMKALNYQMLVDVYGNVPYTQALKGSGNPTPAYDNGLDIYKALLLEIDAGILLIKNAVVNTTNSNRDIATNDIMFHGDKTLWQKFGNTLKLRMLIHCHNVAAINKATEIATIVSNGSGYLGAGQDATVNPGYTGVDKPNSFFNAYITNTDGSANANNVYYKANEWGIEYYAFDGDKRQSRFYVAGTGGLHGVAYGLPPVGTYAAPILAGIGPGLNKGATAPSIIFTAAESFFLQAEAVYRGWIPGGPAQAKLLMETGVRESFTYLGVPNPVVEANAYLLGNATYPDVDYNGVPQGLGCPAGGLFTILSQKWFALNGLSTEEI